MVYKRGNTYWYKFNFTVKAEDGTKQTFQVRRSARTKNLKAAKAIEGGHRDALIRGAIHPLDPWPKPVAPKASSLREFSKRFEEYAGVHTKKSTASFYKECVRRVLLFSPLSDASLDNITGETITKYTAWRLGAKEGNSLAAINA